MRRPRSVSADEARLWRAVLRDVKPLRQSKPLPEPAPEPIPALMPAPVTIPPVASQPVITHPPARPNGIDGQTLKQLRKGERRVEAVIDLHGMTLERAYQALRRFIERQAMAERRCLLVITGKGDHERPGRLKREVPLWLAEWSPPVLAVTSATPRHGGAGALYVLLQRRR